MKLSCDAQNHKYKKTKTKQNSEIKSSLNTFTDFRECYLSTYIYIFFVSSHSDE